MIVCDSLGVGGAADALDYGTPGANTLGHIWQACPDLAIPNLISLGLDEIVDGMEPVSGARRRPSVACALSESSNGKDTITGHWEMMGILTEHPFVSFHENGFPEDLIAELERRTGRTVIGNKAVSGTVILDELGEAEVADSRNMIVYTSADSVMQICGSEETTGLDELYRCCEIARQLTLESPEWKVGRVIARPYVGKRKGEFVRTSNRKDYTVEPPDDTVLDVLEGNGLSTIGIGKIRDIFSGRGLTSTVHTDNNDDGMGKVMRFQADRRWSGLCFANLAEFDEKYGHRRNVEGYASAIEAFDAQLGLFLAKLSDDELVIICADHGNDPTAPGSDHTREKVPFLAYSPSMTVHMRRTDAEGFASVGKTILGNFGLEYSGSAPGEDVLGALWQGQGC